MTDKILSVIEQSKLFDGLDPRLLKKIAAAAEGRQANAGEILFQQGDPANAVWGVLSGRVNQSIRNEDGQEMTIDTILAGEIFGEVGVLDWGQRRAEAAAAEDCHLFRISRRQFLELLQDSPELCFRVFTLLCLHVRGTTEVLEDVALQKLPVRLAKKLTGFVTNNQIDSGSNEKNPKSNEVHITQGDLGRFLGVNRGAVNRHLRLWEKEGWVTLGREKIIINDMAKLSSLAAPAENNNRPVADQFTYYGLNWTPGQKGNISKKAPATPKTNSNGMRRAGLMAVVVSDYSQLMMADAAGTLKALKAGIRTIEKSVAIGGGSVIGQVGDSIIVEFPDSRAALRTAQSIQKKTVPPKTTKSKALFRLGVHAGEIMGDGARTIGPAINITLHLAQMADPGGLYLSTAAQDHLNEASKKNLNFLGTQRLPDIAQSIPVFSEAPISLSKRVLAYLDSLRQYRLWPASALGATAALLILVWVVAHQMQPASLVTIPANSIAVMPFENLSSDPEAAFLADGLSTELRQGLSAHGDLRVIGRESVQYYKDRDDDVTSIGEGLRVAYVLAGSITKSENTFQITAQLINTTDGTIAWSETYDRDITDLFNVQQKITAKVAGAMEVNLGNDGEEGFTKPMTTNPDAYALFLRARNFFTLGMASELIKAVPLLEEAIKLDPNFAEAYALLAIIYLRIPQEMNLVPLDPEELQIKIQATVEEALSLKPDSPKVLATVSAMKGWAGDYVSSLQYAERAVALNDKDPDALWALYVAYWNADDWLAMNETLELLVSLEPLSARVLHIYADNLMKADRLKEAKAITERANSLYPEHRGPKVLLGEIALRQKDPVKAALLAREVRPLGYFLDVWYGIDGINTESLQPAIFAAGLHVYYGDFDLARKIVIDTYLNAPDSSQYLITRGEVEALAGNYIEAIEFFDRARPPLARGDDEFLWSKTFIPWISGQRKSAPALALLYAYRQTGQDDLAIELAVNINNQINDLRQKIDSIGGRDENRFLYKEAQLLAIEGQNTAALETLRRWRRLDPEQFNYPRSDPFLVGLHGEPEFWDIIADLEADLAELRVRIKAAAP